MNCKKHCIAKYVKNQYQKPEKWKINKNISSYSNQ